MKRICIYAKDVSIITGRGQRYAQRLLKDIRFALNKHDHQYITFKEFADYTGIEFNLLTEFIK